MSQRRTIQRRKPRMSEPTPASPPTQPPDTFLIRRELAERIANYLAQRPWAEVHGLLGELMQLRPVQVQASTPSETTAPGDQP